MVPGRLDVPTIITPLSVTWISPTFVSSQLPPTSAFISTITAPDLNFFTASLGTVIGAGRPNILAEDDDVLFGAPEGSDFYVNGMGGVLICMNGEMHQKQTRLMGVLE